jgi:hypothetical protein
VIPSRSPCLFHRKIEQLRPQHLRIIDSTRQGSTGVPNEAQKLGQVPPPLCRPRCVCGIGTSRMQPRAHSNHHVNLTAPPRWFGPCPWSCGALFAAPSLDGQYLHTPPSKSDKMGMTKTKMPMPLSSDFSGVGNSALRGCIAD